jgi:general secretion pathway protein F
LADTLESLTGFAKSLHELRRQIGLALVYPLVVLCVGYMLFLAFLIGMVPQLAEIHRSFQVPQSKWFAMLIFLHETSAFWGPVFPVLILVYTVCWRTSAGSILSVGRSPSRVQRLIAAWVFGWVPWVRLFLSNFHRANFADLLAILVKQGTPLPRAMRLAGEANGHIRIVQDCRTLADDLSDGVSLHTALQGTTAFSPFMKWMMGIGEQQGTLIGALEQIGTIYRRRASQQAEWCSRVLPFMLLFYVGGGATLFYGLTLFLPLAELIERLSLD